MKLLGAAYAHYFTPWWNSAWGEISPRGEIFFVYMHLSPRGEIYTFLPQVETFCIFYYVKRSFHPG